MTNPFTIAAAADGDHAEATSDSIQLLAIATFSGLTALIAALARQQQLAPRDLAAIHGAMARPLDDPLCRDDTLVATLRDAVDRTFADALQEWGDV